MKTIFSIICILIFCNCLFAQSENSRCPSISVTGPSLVTQPDATMFFSVTVGNEEKNYNVKYKWTVDKGKIINGQGTTTIQVSTEGLSDVSLTATFDIEGLPKDCINTDSETGVIAQRAINEVHEYYPKLQINDELTRLDVFLATIDSRGKDLEGFMVFYIDEKNLPVLKKRIKLITKYLDRRNFPKSRITFAIITDNKTKDYTYLWIMPPGTKIPDCESCEVIKASDVN